MLTYIIIIGRYDNFHFAFGIHHAFSEMWGESRRFFHNSSATRDGLFAKVVEESVSRHSLAQSHHLYVSHEQFHLVGGMSGHCHE